MWAKLADGSWLTAARMRAAAWTTLAIGLVMVSFMTWVRIDLVGFLFGDILAVSRADVDLVWGGGILVTFAIIWMWRPLIASTVNPELAEAEGMQPEKTRLVFMLLMALVIAIAMKIVGILLITSLLAGVLAFHNMVNRYLHSVSRSHGLPRALFRTNRHRAPYRAAVTNIVVVLLVLLPFVVLDKDPMTTIFDGAFGPLGARLVMLVILVSFVSCVLSLQAAASRLLYSYARDEMVMGSRLLQRLSPNTHVPTAALVVCGVIPAAIVCIGFYLQNAIGTVVSFAAIGIYLAFQMIVGAALFARLRGWKPSGAFTLGKWGWPVNIAAQVYGLLAIVNMSWPRTPDAPWYINYGIILVGAIVIAVGLVYMTVFKPYDKGTAPAGDAWKLARH